MEYSVQAKGLAWFRPHAAPNFMLEMKVIPKGRFGFAEVRRLQADAEERVNE
jgi:hypothetical protein